MCMCASWIGGGVVGAIACCVNWLVWGVRQVGKVSPGGAFPCVSDGVGLLRRSIWGLDLWCQLEVGVFGGGWGRHPGWTCQNHG